MLSFQNVNQETKTLKAPLHQGLAAVKFQESMFLSPNLSPDHRLLFSHLIVLYYFEFLLLIQLDGPLHPCYLERMVASPEIHLSLTFSDLQAMGVEVKRLVFQ